MRISNLNRFICAPENTRDGRFRGFSMRPKLNAVAEQSKDPKDNQINCDDVVEKLREYQDADTGS